MARRSSAARSSRSRTTGGRSAGTRSAGSRAGRGRQSGELRVSPDGKVDAPCPQCGTKYRVSVEVLDDPLECQACHRVFIPKTTAGKRGKQQDNTKVYVGFGIGALFIVITFVLMSGGSSEPKKAPAPVQNAPRNPYTKSSHPRAQQIAAWAAAFHGPAPDRLTISQRSDLQALATMIEMPDAGTAANQEIVAALLKHPSTQWLRDIKCETAELMSDDMMKTATGNALVYLVPEPGNKDYENNDRAELDVSFTANGDDVQVTGWTIARHIIRKTPDPNRKRIAVNKNIKVAEETQITDSAGTRKVLESEPGPMPHREGTDAALKAKVDEVIAGVLRSADPDGPPLARFTLKLRTLEERKAGVNRGLNAMYELYGDVNGNKMKLSQLDRALRDWTGYAVNFQIRDSDDPARDKKERESCVRQWFGFWWRFSESGLEDFFDMSENLEDDEGEGEKGK